MRRLLVLLPYAVSILATADRGTAQDACSLPLAKAIEVLDSRLSMRVPAQATIQPHQGSIMAAPESSQEETRIVIESGASRMVVMVWELFATTGPDFEKAVRADLSHDPITVERFAFQPPLRGYAFFPSSPQAAANLIWGAYLAQADGTVERIAFYRDRPGAQLRAKCTAKAKEMASSLAPGRRNLQLNGGDSRLGAVSRGMDLFVTLPAGYVTTIKNGIDFTVYKAIKIRSLGVPGAVLAIYIGGHPSFVPKAQKSGSATLFGKKTDWYDSPPGSEIVGTDALVPLPFESGEQLYAHVFAACSTATELPELKKIAGTVSLKPRGRAAR
jgi:hypothetical protein